VAGRLKLIDFGIASSVQSDKTSVIKVKQQRQNLVRRYIWGEEARRKKKEERSGKGMRKKM
jgi:hypothetical protein